MPIRTDQILQRLIKDMWEVRSALRHVSSNLPLYDVANENTPASISTDQNDYVPGNYDVLRINATANISITGIANGKKGRFLEVVNVGTGRISFPDESTSSTAANRIATPYDQTVTVLPNARVRFYYDSTQQRWTVSDLPNIQGEFGKYAVISHSSTTVQTVANLTTTVVSPNTVVTDEWGYWNNTTKKFVIPNGESGLYSLFVNLGVYDSGGAETFPFSIFASTNLGVRASVGYLFNGTYGARENYIFNSYFFLSAGDTLQTNIFQSSTGNVNVEIYAVNNPIFVFSKVG